MQIPHFFEVSAGIIKNTLVTRIVNIKKEKNEKYHETWIRVILTTSAVYMKKVGDIAIWSNFLEVLSFLVFWA